MEGIWEHNSNNTAATTATATETTTGTPTATTTGNGQLNTRSKLRYTWTTRKCDKTCMWHFDFWQNRILSHSGLYRNILLRYKEFKKPAIPIKIT